MGGYAEGRFTAEELDGFDAIVRELGTTQGRFDGADAAALALCRSLFEHGDGPSPTDVDELLAEMARRGRIQPVDELWEYVA